MYRIFAAAAVVTLASASPTTAQTPPTANAPEACATLPANTPRPEVALHVVGGHDSMDRTMLGPRDLLVVDGGRNSGVELGQRFSVRRAPNARVGLTGTRGIVTTGYVHVVAVNDAMALATVDRVCDAILSGDYLQAQPEPPVLLDTSADDSDLDFASPARMLFGRDESQIAGIGEFVATDAGESRGVKPGARFAIYRDIRKAGVPLFAIGEATVVSVGAETSLVRISSASTSVHSGDVLIPRK